MLYYKHMTESIATLEQEIARLQQEVQQRKNALEEAGTTPEQMPSERELVHQAVGDEIQKQVPAYQPIPAPTAPQGGSVAQPSYLTPELQESVQVLVQTALSQGLAAAIAQAKTTNNAALLDAFHDIIVDELYGQLLAARKVEEITE